MGARRVRCRAGFSWSSTSSPRVPTPVGSPCSPRTERPTAPRWSPLPPRCASRAFPALFSPPRGASGAPSDGPWEHLHVTCDLIDPCGALNPDLLVGVAPQRGTSADDISTAGKSKALSRAVPRFWAHRLESSWQASNVGVFEFENSCPQRHTIWKFGHTKKSPRKKKVFPLPRRNVANSVRRAQ